MKTKNQSSSNPSSKNPLKLIISLLLFTLGAVWLWYGAINTNYFEFLMGLAVVFIVS